MNEYSRKMVEVTSTNLLREQDMHKLPVLDVRNLGIDFGGLTAVDGFNMTNIPWLSLTLHVVFAALLYILFISLTRTVGDEDFEWLKSIFKKKPEQL